MGLLNDADDMVKNAKAAADAKKAEENAKAEVAQEAKNAEKRHEDYKNQNLV